jgi:hypothetical protein
MTIKDELMALKNAEGFIVPEHAISWAKKNQRSKLHRALEWDDRRAGHEYRLWQVRRLIAVTCITPEGERQIISLSIDRSRPDGGYRDLADVLPAADLREVLLDDALAELDRVQQKYNSLRELAKIWAEKDAVKTRRTRGRPRKAAGDENRPSAS